MIPMIIGYPVLPPVYPGSWNVTMRNVYSTGNLLAAGPHDAQHIRSRSVNHTVVLAFPELQTAVTTEIRSARRCPLRHCDPPGSSNDLRTWHDLGRELLSGKNNSGQCRHKPASVVSRLPAGRSVLALLPGNFLLSFTQHMPTGPKYDQGPGSSSIEQCYGGSTASAAVAVRPDVGYRTACLSFSTS